MKRRRDSSHILGYPRVQSVRRSRQRVVWVWEYHVDVGSWREPYHRQRRRSAFAKYLPIRIR